MQDMELMRHYTIHVAQTPLGLREDAEELFRTCIPSLGMKYDFLLHSVLTLSALNLAFLHPENSLRYLQICDKHQAM